MLLRVYSPEIVFLVKYFDLCSSFSLHVGGWRGAADPQVHQDIGRMLEIVIEECFWPCILNCRIEEKMFFVA